MSKTCEDKGHRIRVYPFHFPQNWCPPNSPSLISSYHSATLYRGDSGRSLGWDLSMCLTIQMFIFSCGHRIYQDPVCDGECLFEKNPQMCRELGSLRRLPYYEKRLCPQCGWWRPYLQPVAQRDQTLLNTWFGQGKNRVKDLLEGEIQCLFPTPQRWEEMNRVAMYELLGLLENPKFNRDDDYEWIVRYIASLPEFMDRESLICALEPSIGHVFDESLQDKLLPLFLDMNIPDIYEMTMVWKREVPGA